MARIPASVIKTLVVSVSLAGCGEFGPTKLGDDQLGYARALSTAQKQQTLLNVVRLRYGDTPGFLDVTQVISGYQLQRSVTGGFEAFPSAAISTYLSGGATAQLQQSPTFTFQPVTGEHFAQGFLRPLSPGDLLPLAQGGLPVDILFRLAVQSIGYLQNAAGLEQTAGQGSAEFFTLLHDLRLLQIAGLIAIRLQDERKVGGDGKPAPGPKHVFLSFTDSLDPNLADIVAQVRRLLALPKGEREAEVVYGRVAGHPGQIALLTRPMLGVLAQLAFQIEVPVRDVELGLTVATVGQVPSERKPVVVVHSGYAAPDSPFAVVRYEGRWFWISKDDFDSKLAFTIINILLALAQTTSGPGTVTTIPAG